MIVDCSTCTVRGDACSGCVVSLLFGSEPGGEVPWHRPGFGDLPAPTTSGRALARGQDDVDRAVAVLAAAGMLDVRDAPVPLTLSQPMPGLRSLRA